MIGRFGVGKFGFFDKARRTSMPNVSDSRASSVCSAPNERFHAEQHFELSFKLWQRLPIFRKRFKLHTRTPNLSQSISFRANSISERARLWWLNHRVAWSPEPECFTTQTPLGPASFTVVTSTNVNSITSKSELVFRLNLNPLM